MTSISNGESGLSVRTKLNASLAITDAFNVSNGNVGIGVIPSAWSGSLSPSLQLNGGASFAGHSVVKSTFLGSNYYYDGVYRYYSSDFAAQYQMYQGNHIWYNAPSGTVGNVFTFTQAMTLDASGNLGIGATPSAWGSSTKSLSIGPIGAAFIGARTDSFRLNVGLNAYDTGSDTWKYTSGISASLYQQVDGLHKWFNAPSGTAGAAITFTQAMTLDASGNLGIGTSSPGAKLEINAGANTDLRINTSASGYLQVGQFANGAFIGTSSTDATAGVLRLGTGATERMRIDASGSVGIGTSAPTQSLDVNGAINMRGDGSSVAAYMVINTALRQSGSAGTMYFDVGSGGSSGQFVFRSSSSLTERMRIDSNGNVGIGTTSPNAASMLDAQSTTKGVRFPNMTTTQKNAIANVAGNVVFDTTLGKLCLNTGSGWQTITSV